MRLQTRRSRDQAKEDLRRDITATSMLGHASSSEEAKRDRAGLRLHVKWRMGIPPALSTRRGKVSPFNSLLPAKYEINGRYVMHSGCLFLKHLASCGLPMQPQAVPVSGATNSAVCDISSGATEATRRLDQNLIPQPETFMPVLLQSRAKAFQWWCYCLNGMTSF